MNDLMLALKEALAAIGETDPRELDEADRALWHACDQRIEQIIERLVRDHDEAGSTARSILQRIAAM